MAMLHPSLGFLDIFSGPELTVILAAVVIFFGGEKMPEFARGLGKALREFRKAANEVEQEIKRAMDELDHPAPSRTIRPPPAILPHAPDGSDFAPDPGPDPGPAADPGPIADHPRSHSADPSSGLD